MKRRACMLLMIASLMASSHLSSQSIANATSTAQIAAHPKDVASADAIVAALYDANTIMVDQKRDTDRFRSLFVPGARLMPTARASNGPAVINVQTVDDYVRTRIRARHQQHSVAQRRKPLVGRRRALGQRARRPTHSSCVPQTWSVAVAATPRAREAAPPVARASHASRAPSRTRVRRPTLPSTDTARAASAAFRRRALHTLP